MEKILYVTRNQACFIIAVTGLLSGYLGWQLYNLWFHEYGIPQKGRYGGEINFHLFFWMKFFLFVAISSVLFRVRIKDS
ncbi:hypothetical protein VSU01S_30190 [Vibrio superstes NBRC 103154]|uniref:Uncharacterized protein n=1 Tax=Vibrio superstes NBRC 103154 TaxID=1219062 RepID=A0A511QTU9_9VIBR|nr:hypothetical protein VSU01S_30190 [Vibrio superstes NBRC 103154]